MIIIKTESQIEKIREASKITAAVIEYLKNLIKPGVSTIELDKKAEKFIRQHNAEPGFKGYKGFPSTLCTSINSQVVHGIPNARKILRDGDIVSIDVGVKKSGYYGDMAYTFSVGHINEDKKHLIKVTKTALAKGIAEFLIGNRLYSISNAIQTYVEKNGCSIVRDYVGHGIGKKLHEDPQIPNYGKANTGARLKKGMVFAIEPMVNLGKPETVLLDDNWTVETKDGSMSAHFEHTVVLTDNGPEILTHG